MQIKVCVLVENVSDQEGDEADSTQGSSPRPRPRRERRPATRYAGNEWDTRT
jgi:hypothetical protein